MHLRAGEATFELAVVRDIAVHLYGVSKLFRASLPSLSSEPLFRANFRYISPPCETQRPYKCMSSGDRGEMVDRQTGKQKASNIATSRKVPGARFQALSIREVAMYLKLSIVTNLHRGSLIMGVPLPCTCRTHIFARSDARNRTYSLTSDRRVKKVLHS